MHNLPQQARSGDTEKRIAAAAREILRTKRFHEVKMSDIAGRAGVSIGGLYARFPSKESLAAYLVDRGVFDVLAKETEKLVDDTDATAEDVVRRYLKTAATLYRRNRFALRALYVATRAGTDDALRRRVRNFNAAIHERLRTAILARCAGATDQAVSLAILSTMATLREVVLFGQPVSDLARMSEATLIDELVKQFLAYLGCKRKKR